MTAASSRRKLLRLMRASDDPDAPARVADFVQSIDLAEGDSSWREAVPEVDRWLEAALEHESLRQASCRCLLADPCILAVDSPCILAIDSPSRSVSRSELPPLGASSLRADAVRKLSAPPSPSRADDDASSTSSRSYDGPYGAKVHPSPSPPPLAPGLSVCCLLAAGRAAGGAAGVLRER